MRMGAQFCQNIRDHHIFQAIDNPDCNESLFVLLLEQDCKVKDYLHEVHKCEVALHNPGHLVCKNTQLIFFSLADCNRAF